MLYFSFHLRSEKFFKQNIIPRTNFSDFAFLCFGGYFGKKMVPLTYFFYIVLESSLNFLLFGGKHVMFSFFLRSEKFFKQNIIQRKNFADFAFLCFGVSFGKKKVLLTYFFIFFLESSLNFLSFGGKHVMFFFICGQKNYSNKILFQ